MSVLNFEQARHLVTRTGFGPELEAIQQFHQTDLQQAVRNLLDTPHDFLLALPTPHSLQEIRSMRKVSREQKKLARKQVRSDINAVKSWAIEQALQNPNALQEKMVWFWHNHFTSSSRNSRRSAELLLNQTQLIRQHAMGSFADLLRAMPYDPLMLLYLNGNSNRKARPNENFARELLELFTLGEGHYSEQDVKETARAFTGWRMDKTGAVVKRKRHFDAGVKTIFGQSGNFDSDEVIELLLQHPRTAEWIAEKMWSTFISITTPNPSTIKQWAAAFRDSGYDISTLLQAVLTSDAFWLSDFRATLIKSPLDLIIGTARTLDLEDNDLPLGLLRNQLRRMGQDLYTPPNVKGWPGGMTWVDDFTLPLRQQFTRRLTRGNNHHKTDPAMQNTMTMQRNKKSNLSMSVLPTLAPQFWEQWLLPQAAVTDTQNADPRKHLQAILLDPAYQLK